MMRFTNIDQPQDIAVVIQIRGGSFTEGFPITLQILEHGRPIYESKGAKEFCLPAAPNMRKLYQQWQVHSQEGSRRLQGRLLEVVQAQETNISEAENLAVWQDATEALKGYCKDWFGRSEFSQLRDRILSNSVITQESSIPIIIRCDDDHADRDLISRLPFHFWDLYNKLPNAEFALFNQFNKPAIKLNRSVKVLAIFGSSVGGLKLEQDAAALRSLENHGARITQVLEPSNEELCRLLSDQVWDILFFAGHSSSVESSGRIQIRANRSLSLDNLRPSLVDAVHKGLTLAIFNSCDGLGIAEFLKEAGVQNIIVMKEPVPDDIACLFLTEFLREFTQGTQLCQSIRRARRRIALEQDDFPAASWLPAVFLNPSAPELALPRPGAFSFSRISRFSRTQIVLGSLLSAGLAIATPLVLKYQCQLLPRTFTTCPIPVEDFISSGDRSIKGSKVILASEYSSLKKNGIKSFADGEYEDAINLFDSLRAQAKQNKNQPDIRAAALTALQDPEVLIYRNNALARMRHAENPQSPMYTIAVAASMNNEPGINIFLGVAQAQDVAVKNGLNLQLAIANDMNKTQQAQEVAKNLSRNQDILAVVGHYTSPNTCEALKVYAPNGLVLVAPTSTMVKLSANCGDGSHDVFFRTVSNTRVEAQTLIDYLINDLRITQPKVVAFYNSQELFSQDMFDQFEEVLKAKGGDIIATVDLSDPNFKPEQLPSQVKQASAIAILSDGGTNNRTVLEKSLKILQTNKGKQPILGANTLYLPAVLDLGKGALTNRLFLAVDWHPQMCGAEEFSTQLREYWGGDLNRRSVLAYEAIQVITSVLPATANQPTTRDDIRRRLARTGIVKDAAPQSDVFQGQTISFDEKGDRKEITTRLIVTVNDQNQFALTEDANCPASSTEQI
ncbi:ABC transporter substrate-binding protein [Nodularia harveyana UHCC-0300]|uniref:ABC transporter substrate-binding protein n=1 Tax=Nodularia harveyana UHCC-0300 TaxID=2974287 RepID=A0ABU5UB51_9CYAN|nr:ABC transporter substrate-binding protein [Nodularia harveyana]MEA5580763.1 ABC transporter substrate-binding protein [Nodularia harveyana UHCC-0300]